MPRLHVRLPSLDGRRPSPAMVVACVALAVALSGTGIAAVTAALPRNSVGTAQLKNNAVTSQKVLNGSLLKADFAAGQLPAGKPGQIGPPGPAGPQGLTGPQGPTGLVGDITLHSASVDVPPTLPAEDGKWGNRNVQANCDSDEKGVGGGTNWSGEGDNVELTTVLSTPIYDPTSKRVTGWRARGGNDTAGTHTFTVFVLCTKAS